MGILGIENRTENWKSAQLLRARSEAGLARRLGEPDVTPADDIRIELFWYGVRDSERHLERSERHCEKAVAIYTASSPICASRFATSSNNRFGL